MASEVNAELAARAKENLSSYGNVTVSAGDGIALQSVACDAILINAGVTHPPRAWLDHLAEGGRMIVPITMAVSSTGLGKGVMLLVRREEAGPSSDAKYSARVLTMVAIYSCSGGRDPELEPLVAKVLTDGAWTKLRSVRVDTHEKTDTCILHGNEMCLSATETAQKNAA